MNKSKKNIVLKTDDLCIGYQSKKSVKVIQKNIDLSFEKGELIAVLGKNGVGKSTLLKTLSGAHKAISGDIKINDKKNTNFTDLELAKVLSLVLTENIPTSRLTVYELVALGRQPYTNWVDTLTEKDLNAIEKAFELTEIEHLKNNYFFELSDGQLQRVLIARAIAQDTDIVILDEPTNHLDIHHTYKILSLLKKLVKQTHKTIIFSTHEVNLAIKIADNFVLLTDNNLEYGSASELIHKKSFHKLFPEDVIYFDEELKQFIIKNI